MKRIRYQQKPATAVYFQDMINHVKQMHLESKYLVEQNRLENLQSYTSTISHEFRTPIGNCLMFLESLIARSLAPDVLRILNLIVSQLNLLLCLVNDVLDIKLKAGSVN